MRLGNEDKKIVFCIPERQTSHDIGQGFIRPVFEETVDGLKPIDEDVFKNNGLIRVTKGYSSSFNQEGRFYKVEADISNSWDELIVMMVILNMLLMIG